MSKEATVVQIDPGLALCWEQRETIRIGFDRGHVRVTALSPEAQRVFQKLVTGMPEEDFHALTQHRKREQHSVECASDGQHSPETNEIHELIISLMPVLVRQRAQPPVSPAAWPGVPSALRTAMHDDGRELPGLRTALEANWLCNIERSKAPPELAVQVLRFLEPLERTRRWLGAGIPQLLIRLTDDAIRVGPLISPNGAPCHGCEVMHLTEADEALPQLAVQLHGRTPGSETAENGQLIGAIAAHIVRAWRQGEQWVHTSQIVLPVSKRQISGLATHHTLHPHPECGCSLNRFSTKEDAGNARVTRTVNDEPLPSAAAQLP